MKIDEFLDRMEDTERHFVGREFLAPVVGSGRVAVRIAGVVCMLRVTHGLPENYEGWAILRSISMNEAVFVRQAGLSEILSYLGMLPAIRLILLHENRSTWLALPANRGDSRFKIEGSVNVWLVDKGPELFETVISRFDGRSFWFDRRDPCRDPSLAAYLRQKTQEHHGSELTPLTDIVRKPGLSREEKEAFKWVIHHLDQIEIDRIEGRIRDALSHAGGIYRSYNRTSGGYVVRYTIEGRNYVSTVKGDDLSVVTAGVCLRGKDRDFDLTSLVGVLRESGGGQLHR